MVLVLGGHFLLFSLFFALSLAERDQVLVQNLVHIIVVLRKLLELLEQKLIELVVHVFDLEVVPLTLVWHFGLLLLEVVQVNVLSVKNHAFDEVRAKWFAFKGCLVLCSYLLARQLVKYVFFILIKLDVFKSHPQQNFPTVEVELCLELDD